MEQLNKLLEQLTETNEELKKLSNEVDYSVESNFEIIVYTKKEK